MDKFIECLKGISVSDWTGILTLLTVIAGGIFGLMQWNKSNKYRRAEFIDSLVTTIRNDEELSTVVYMFDYDHKWYTQSFHNKEKELERVVDKTLSYFSYICYLKNNKILSKKDFNFFEYEIKRIAANRSVQAYLYNLYHFAKKNDCEHSFKYLFDYCYTNKLFIGCEDIKSITDSFPKYLNF